MIVFDTDPWWKQLLARITGHPIWHQMGYIDNDTDPVAIYTDDDCDQLDIDDLETEWMRRHPPQNPLA